MFIEDDILQYQKWHEFLLHEPIRLIYFYMTQSLKLIEGYVCSVMQEEYYISI